MNPSVPPSRMAFVNELEGDLTTDLPAQRCDEFTRVSAGNYLTFNKVLSFPKSERRLQSP